MIAPALLLASAQAAAAPYPSAEVLAAFGEVCRDVEDLERSEAKAKAAGWTAVTPEAGTPIEQLVTFGMETGKKMVEAVNGSVTPMRVLRRDVAGEQLHVIFSGVRMADGAVNGCRLYDVGETRPIAITEAEKWVGRAASRSQSSEALSIANWQPGYAPGHDSFELFFIPADSPMLPMVKVSGVALKADYVGSEN